MMDEKRLLIIAHTPSSNLLRLADAAINAACQNTYSLIVESVPPHEANANHVLNADGLLFGTCENLASMAGLSKDFFDRCYYSIVDKKQGLPIASYIRAGHDGTGTKRQLEAIITGLKWRWIAAPLVLKGQWNNSFAKDVADLSAGLALGIEQGVY